MPVIYRRRRRRPRRYIRRYFRRRFRRFVNGSSKSQIRVKIPWSATFDLANVGKTGVVMSAPFTPFAAIKNNTAHEAHNMFSALNSPLYRSYCDLYDEVKCIGGKVVLSIGTPVGTSSVPSLTIVTAWDRKYCGAYGSSVDAPPTASELLNYSSQQKATAVNNSIAKLVRTCYASDLMEKAMWHDCTLHATTAQGVVDGYAEEAGRSSSAFNPAMWLGVSQTGSSNQTISFQADITWYFAFRNPKYGGSASDSRAITRKSPLDFPVSVDEDASMDADMSVGDGEVIHDETTRVPVTSIQRDSTGTKGLVAELRRQRREMDDLMKKMDVDPEHYGLSKNG